MVIGKSNYKKLSLEELVILSQKKDFKALQELIKREQKNVFAAFLYLSKNRENVADLTQEALLRMARSISTLKNPKTFKSWLNHITTNLFYDELRKTNRRPEMISIDEDYAQNPITALKTQIQDKHCKPMEKCISAEIDKVIKTEIQNLPEHFRIVIILRELQGLSYEEIAKATDTSVGTVKSRIARARSKLQDGLKAYI